MIKDSMLSVLGIKERKEAILGATKTEERGRVLAAQAYVDQEKMRLEVSMSKSKLYETGHSKVHKLSFTFTSTKVDLRYTILRQVNN